MTDIKSIDRLTILGNHVQALGLCRQASRLGLQVILYNQSKISIARYSRDCQKFHHFSCEEELLMNLLQEKGKRSLIMPTNDRMVEFIIKNFDELNKRFHLPYKNTQSVINCVNKISSYQIASQNNIPIPVSFFPTEINEVNRLAPILVYPVILKPAIMHNYHPVTGKKAMLCQNESQLKDNYENILKVIPGNEVIIQEFIDSGPSELYSVGAYCENGKIIGGLMANRERQNPMTFGNSTCYAKTVFIPEIYHQAEQILSALCYSGICEVEFMFDSKTNKYKFLEVNARAWKWHSLGDKLDINLIGLWLEYISGKKTDPIIIKDSGTIWVEHLTDIYICTKEILSSRMKFSSFIRSYRFRKQFAIWSLRDPLPMLMYLILLPILFFKR